MGTYKGTLSLRGGLHTRLRAHDHYTSSTLIGGKDGSGPNSLHTTYAWGTHGVSECKMDVKSTWICAWHQMDHVSWSLGLFFNNHLLKVGLTQNREIMALWTLTTVDLSYFIMCEDLHESTFIEIAFGWGLSHIWLHTILEGPWPHYMILEVPWDGLWTLFLGSHNFHGHGSWLLCEVAMRLEVAKAAATTIANKCLRWRWAEADTSARGNIINNLR